MKEEGDSDWESVEEDAPVVKLDELLSNLRIEGDDDEEEEKQ